MASKNCVRFSLGALKAVHDVACEKCHSILPESAMVLTSTHRLCKNCALGIDAHRRPEAMATLSMDDEVSFAEGPEYDPLDDLELIDRSLQHTSLSGSFNKSITPVRHDQPGEWCHQCKQKHKTENLIVCGKCAAKRYCTRCITRHYNVPFPEVLMRSSWTCFVCRNECNCAACRKKCDKRRLPEADGPRKRQRLADVGAGGALYKSVSGQPENFKNPASMSSSSKIAAKVPKKRGRKPKVKLAEPAPLVPPAEVVNAIVKAVAEFSVQPSTIIAANRSVKGDVAYLLGSGEWVSASTVTVEAAQEFLSSPLLRLPIRKKAPPIPHISPIKSRRTLSSPKAKFANAHQHVVSLQELVASGFVPNGASVSYKSLMSHSAVIDSTGKLSLGLHTFTTLSQFAKYVAMSLESAPASCILDGWANVMYRDKPLAYYRDLLRKSKAQASLGLSTIAPRSLTKTTVNLSISNRQALKTLPIRSEFRDAETSTSAHLSLEITHGTECVSAEADDSLSLEADHFSLFPCADSPMDVVGWPITKEEDGGEIDSDIDHWFSGMV